MCIRDSQEIEALKIAAGLKGQSPWGVKLGVGSFLTMEFGDPREKQLSSFVHGDWGLWLYMCNWRIEIGSEIVTGSNDDRSVIEAALKELLLGPLETVTLLDPALDLSLQFSSRTKLLTFSSSSNRDEEQWKLFTPDGHCLTICGDGSAEYPLAS